MRRDRAVPALLGLFLAAGVLTPAGGTRAQVPAGAIEVVVRERDGGPIADQVVSVVPADDDGSRRRHHVDRTKTDKTGRALFTGLAPGRYAVRLGRLAKDLVPPEENPWSSPPRVTVLPGDTTPRRVGLELWRGVPVSAEVRVAGGRPDGFVVSFHHRQTGRTLRVPTLNLRPVIERRLVPGDWTLEVEPLPGYLLVAVEHNGGELDNHRVTLDLVGAPEGHLVSWSYVAPARLEGMVDAGEPATVEVVATLVEPGPWIDAALRLGGSRFERVPARTDRRTDVYRMVLPDGRWRVMPVGDAVLESEPAERLIELAPGDVGRADFRVRLRERERERGETLMIAVRRPDSTPASGAWVEVYADDGSLEPSSGEPPVEPLRAGRSAGSSGALLPGLEPGRYRAVATHRDFLAAETTFEVREDETQRATVRLRPGAEIRIEARDGERPLLDVEVVVARLGEAPPFAITAEEARAAKLRREVVTDHSGRASVAGLYPGRYRLDARLLGTGDVTGRVELALADDDFVESLELGLTGTETVEVHARRARAAAFALTAVCDDGKALPPVAAVRVVPLDGAVAYAGEDGTARLELAAEPEVALARDELSFSGSGRDVLRVGPLRPGIYHLALRPRGFDRWIWAFATEDPAAAAQLQALSAGSPTDLGAFQLECAPAIDLRPEVPSGDPLPDLRAARVEARVLDAAGEHELARPRIVRDVDRVRLRLLPAGRWRLVFALEHPHFLPRPRLEFEAVLEMARGGFQIGAPRIAAIGGALRVDGRCALLRVHGPGDAPPRELPCAGGGRTLVPSLAPGTYRVELCADAACAPPLARTDGVVVARGETVELK